MGKWETDLEAAVAEGGDVDTRSSLGQMFNRGPAKSEEYRKLKTSEKAEFRKTWAQQLWDQVSSKRSRVSTQSLEDDEGFRAEYLNFDNLIIALGGFASEEAQKAAVTYRDNCREKPGWVRTNKMSGQEEFKYVRAYENMSNKNTRKLENGQDVVSDPTSLSTSPGGNGSKQDVTGEPDPKKLDGKPDPKNLNEVKPDPKKLDGKPDPKNLNEVKPELRTRGQAKPAPKKKASALQRLRTMEVVDDTKSILKAQVDMKTAYSAVVADMATLEMLVVNDESWSWATKDEHRESLKSAKHDVGALLTDEFIKDYITLTGKMLSEKYTDRDLSALASNKVDGAMTTLECCRRTMDKLRAFHDLMQK